MALSGSFSSSKYYYSDTTSPTHVEVIWSATQSIPNNTSTISWSCYARNANGDGDPNGWYYVMAGPVVVTINGTTVLNKSDRFAMYSNALLGSGTITVSHNTDGTKSVAVGISAAIYTYATSSTYSGTITLDTIPRYPTVSHSLSSKTETSITMNWSSNSTINYVKYSTDWGTTWVDVGAVNASSGTYTINRPSSGGSALTENTTYNIITKLKRKDSGLESDSDKLSVTTYSFPYCVATPDFTIGDPLTLNIYNPLSRSITIRGYAKSNNKEIFNGSTAGAEIVGFNDPGSIANEYAYIPNSASGAYYVVVTYGSITKTTDTGNVYKIRGDEVPTINSFDYVDNNQRIAAITGNNKHIVQNQSVLLAQFSAATPNKSAGSIAKYVVSCNGKTVEGSVQNGAPIGTVDSASNVDLVLTVTDSRGLSSSKTIKVTMIPYSTPSAIVTLKRLNNYEDETHLTVDGTVSSVNGKNTMTIQYQYKELGGNYNGLQPLEDNKEKVFKDPGFDKNKVFIFNIVVSDAIGGTPYTREHTLGKGVFPLFIDVEKNSVGVNCFPHNNDSFEVDGLGSFNSIKCKNLLYTPYTESNKLTLTATTNDHFQGTGYYCRLEKNKKYTFHCETDAAWGGQSGTDTVEAYLLKDNEYTTYVKFDTNPQTFTVPSDGVYFLRYDVNKSGATHSFWNFQVEEGSFATGFAEAKQFEYQERYFLEEHKVGYWFTGKPIYRRIISLSANQFGTTESQTGKNIDIAHGISNIKEIVKTEDMWCTNGQYRRFPSNYYGNAGWDGQYHCSNTNITFELGAAVYNRLIAQTTFLYVVIYYTKTTD